MKVENVARIGFTPWGAAQQQGHLSICDSLLGQIVIDNDRMHAVVTKIFAHGAAGIRCQELQRCGLGRGGGDNDGIFHGASIFQGLHDLSDRGALLADRDIDTVQLLALIITLIDRLLVDEGVNRHGGLAGLAVTNDQLALAAANGNQAVQRLQAGLHGFMHRFARDDTRRLDVHQTAFIRLDRALAIDGIAQGVDNAAQQALAHGYVNDFTGTFYCIAFGNGGVGTENNDADVIAFQVQGHTFDTAGEFHHFAGLYLIQTVNAGDTITHGQNLANLRDFGFGAEVGDLLF